MGHAPGDQILVVDDDENIRQIVRILLSDEGYEVLEASNGQAALELLGGVQPELILLDLRMPVMDGWEFAQRYSLMPGKHAPIIACVAALDATTACEGVPAVAILSKPFDLDDLLEAVRSHRRLVS
jgi:CheY-like chemotaxis protein